MEGPDKIFGFISKIENKMIKSIIFISLLFKMKCYPGDFLVLLVLLHSRFSCTSGSPTLPWFSCTPGSPVLPVPFYSGSPIFLVLLYSWFFCTPGSPILLVLLYF